MTIRARPLHAQARQVVLERILRGDLEPGTRLVESRLARDLGISRTPLREALMHLEREGFLDLEPNRGFFVAPVSTVEAEELYPILALLETHALALTGPPGDSRVSQLEELNERLLAHEHSAEQAFSINVEWHAWLTSGCPNRLLLRLLARVRRKVHRYEWAYFGPGKKLVSSESPARVRDRIRNAVESHHTVLSALESGEMANAVDALQRHWIDDLKTLLPEMSNTA